MATTSARKSAVRIRTQARRLTVGRGLDNDIVIDDAYVDAKHIVLRETDASGTWELEDLSSTNGTSVAGHPVGTTPATLALSTEITIGKTRGVDLKARGFFVKAVHVRVNVEPGEVIRLSCPSGSGIQLNGQQITEGFLKPGDELTVGRSKFRLVASLAGEPTNA